MDTTRAKWLESAHLETKEEFYNMLTEKNVNLLQTFFKRVKIGEDRSWII